MRRYTIEIAGRAWAVDVEDTDASRFRVVVDGQDYDVRLTAQEEMSVASITPSMGAGQPSAGGGAGPGASAATAVPSGAAPAAVAARAAVPPRPAAGGATVRDVLAAPMPGVILRLAVAPGATVRRGDDVAVLEAMKMENTLRAPRDGVVAEVCVEPGQQVAHGQPLVRFAAGA